MKLKDVLMQTAIWTFLFNLSLLGAGDKLLATETDTANRCSSIPVADAASILGVSSDDLQVTSSDLPVSPEDIQKKMYATNPYNCTIRSTSDFLKSIIFNTYIYNDPVLARQEFNRMRQGYASVSKVDTVPETGDETFWAGDKRFQRMVAIRGNVVIDTLTPKDFTHQKKILGIVLERLE